MFATPPTSAEKPRYRLQACTGQHIGDRLEQQDRVRIIPSAKSKGTVLIILADGMGGKTGGVMAAEQVITTAENLFKDFSPKNESAEKLLTDIAFESHTAIKLSGITSEKEPHSTMVALIIQPDRADWAHVGDSRLYYFRRTTLQHRTTDHSFAELLAREQGNKPVDVRLQRLGNVLTSALGSQKSPEVSHGSCTDLQPGDRFLICSDGLWNYFRDSMIGAILDEHSPRQASEILIDTARQRARGHGDNCTFAIAKLESPT